MSWRDLSRLLFLIELNTGFGNLCHPGTSPKLGDIHCKKCVLLASCSLFLELETIMVLIQVHNTYKCRIKLNCLGRFISLQQAQMP
jgi:hypothetical protein